MTAPELTSYFNRIFGIEKEWPKQFEVDAETYANCCQFVFDRQVDGEEITRLLGDKLGITVFVGEKHKGLAFKGVELILIGYERK